jgi:hypothetical protein
MQELAARQNKRDRILFDATLLHALLRVWRKQKHVSGREVDFFHGVNPFFSRC